MEEQKQSYLMYVNYYDILKDLKNEDLGLLFRAIMAYQKKVEYELNPSIMIAFNFIQNQFEIDSNKHEKIKERNKNNGKKGGRRKTQKTQQKHNDNDNDNDNVFLEKKEKKEKTQNNPDNPVGFLGFENNPTKPNETQNNPTKPNETQQKHNDNDNVFLEKKEKIQNKQIPTKEEIKEYLSFLDKTMNIDNFYNYWDSVEWLDKNGMPIRWKQKVITWANRTNENKTSKSNTLLPQKIDTFLVTTPIERKFKEEYKKIFNNHLYLITAHKNKINELNAEIEDFENTIPIVLKRLKEINFKNIGFKPSVDWLLKNTNYTSVLNGEYEKEKSNLIAVLEQERERVRQEELLKQQGGTTK